MILLNNWSQVCEKSICQGSFLIKLLVYFPSNITWELYILQNTSFSENVKFTVGAHFFVSWEVHKEMINSALEKKVVNHNVFWKRTTSQALSKISKKFGNEFTASTITS